jgi:hypothetical protein
MKSLVMLLLAASLPAAAAAQNATSNQNDPFNGTWKLDVSKSHFSPGPAPSSETVTIAPHRVSVHDAIKIEGEERTADWSYTVAQEGQPARISGRGENSTVISKRVNGNTIEDTWNFNGLILHGQGVLSNNGKTMCYTLTGTSRDGQSVHDVEIFKKEKP